MKLQDKKFIQASISATNGNVNQNKDQFTVTKQALHELRSMSRQAQAYDAMRQQNGNQAVSFVSPKTGKTVTGYLLEKGKRVAKVQIDDGLIEVVPNKACSFITAEEKQALDSSDITDGEVVDVLDPETDVKAYADVDGQMASPGQIEQWADEGIVADVDVDGRLTDGMSYSREADAYASQVVAQLRFPSIEVVQTSLQELAEYLQDQGGTYSVALNVSDDGSWELIEDDSAGTTITPSMSEGRLYQIAKIMVRDAMSGGSKTVTAADPAPGASSGTQTEPNPAEAAKFLASTQNKQYIQRALSLYFKNGGGEAMSKVLMEEDTPVHREMLLAASMPIIKQVDHKLWNEIVSGYNTEVLRKQPGAETVKDPAKPAQEIPENLEFESDELEFMDDQQLNTLPKEKLVQNIIDMRKKSGSNKSTRKTAGGKWEDKVSDSELDAISWTSRVDEMFEEQSPERVKRHKSQGIKPAAIDIQASMSVVGTGRSGDYVDAIIKFDPKMFSELNDAEGNAEISVNAFVGRHFGQKRAGMDFGYIGPITIREMDVKKGTALVRFLAEGHAPVGLVTVDDLE